MKLILKTCLENWCYANVLKSYDVFFVNVPKDDREHSEPKNVRCNYQLIKLNCML